jgi:hypothetical protein
MGLSQAEARQRRNRYLAIGVPLFAVTLLEIAIGWLLLIDQSESAPQSLKLFSPPALNILKWIRTWQLGCWQVGPSLAQSAPVFRPAHGLDPANLYVAFWAVLFFAAGLLLHRGRRLHSSLAETRRDTQRRVWANQTSRQPMTTTASASAEIDPFPLLVPSLIIQQDKWYARPLGIIVLAIIGGILYILIVQYVMKLVGWGR